MINKINNLLKFTEYDHLQPKQKPTNRTEIGGFAVLEGLSVAELLKLAAEKSGKSEKKLRDLSPKKLKKLIGGEKPEKKDKKKEKDEVEEKDEVKNESLLLEKKKASAKQKAARARFMEMINSKKKGKTEEKTDESLILEKKKASAKQAAARARFMEMIGKKKGKGKKEEKED